MRAKSAFLTQRDVVEPPSPASGRGNANRKTAAGATSDRRIALGLVPSLQAIADELDVYAALLRRWQKSVNLVAPSTLDRLWTRHFADSAQICEHFPDISAWADLGSGAGFPALVMAIALKGRPGGVVHLIESDQRKAAFLRAVSRETEAPAIVHVGRIEQELPLLEGKIEGITARALAPLPQLVAWSASHLEKNVIDVFLKGEDWAAELTAAQLADSLQARPIESRTNPAARIIAIAKDLGALGGQRR